MTKREIQEKLNNLPKPKYLYQRYNGEIKKYEIQDNILINTKNANDIINISKTLILGKTSENILDLLEVGDIVIHGIETMFTTIFEDKSSLNYFINLYDNDNLKASIKQIVTNEQLKNIKFEV